MARAVAVSGSARLHGRARHERRADPLVPGQSRARPRPGRRHGGARRAKRRLSPPGARGIVFLPYFSGERTPLHDPQAKGAFFGLNLTHARADMYRALLEGIAYGTNHILDTYAENGGRPARFSPSGAGCATPCGCRPRPTSRAAPRPSARRASARPTATPFWRRWPSAMSAPGRSTGGTPWSSGSNRNPRRPRCTAGSTPSSGTSTLPRAISWHVSTRA